MNKIQNYILEFALYDSEPLFIIVGAIKDKFSDCKDEEISSALIELRNLKYLSCDSHGGRSKDDYVDITNTITFEQLEKRLKEQPVPSGDLGYYYPKGTEYFFKTTKKGIKDNNLDILFRSTEGGVGTP